MATSLNDTIPSAIPTDDKTASTRNRPPLPVGLLSDALTVDEAAAALGCHRATLNRLRVDGGGPRYIAALGRITYRKAWLVEWLETKTRENTTFSPERSEKAKARAKAKAGKVVA